MALRNTETAMKVLNHEELRITFREQLALLAFISAGKAGLLVDLPDEIRLKPNTNRCNLTVVKLVKDQHTFNMCYQGAQNADCGSVGCIGGYMALAMGLDMVRYVNLSNMFANSSAERHSPALSKLFYPGYLDMRTLKEAIRAAERFLAGKEPWKKLSVGELDKRYAAQQRAKRKLGYIK